MTASFVYIQRERKLVFGRGKRHDLAKYLDELGARRVFVISDPNGADVVADIVAPLADKVLQVWTDVRQHVPEDLAAAARDQVTRVGADSVVSFGGGSSTGLAKAIALSHGLPIIAIPTTYAGSEQTTIYGVTGNRHKQTGSNPIVLPRVSIYDVELTLGLPKHVTGASAFNALAHCINGLSAMGANPVTSAIALEGVRAIVESLPSVMAHPGDVEPRERLQYGAAMAGITLGDTSTGLHHKICHVLGGTFNLVHADAHSVILPHSTAFNASALPREMARLSEALGCRRGDEGGALWELAKRSDVPISLKQLGLESGQLHETAERAAKEISSNPRPVTAELLETLLKSAYAGTRP
jgi:maleylacetate reductase